MQDNFHTILDWLEQEREYQTNKFDYEAEAEKGTDYWMQQFNNYLYRIPLFTLDTPQGAQAVLKLAATAVACAEHLVGKNLIPAPGVSSGEIQEWDQD